MVYDKTFIVIATCYCTDFSDVGYQTGKHVFLIIFGVIMAFYPVMSILDVFLEVF